MPEPRETAAMSAPFIQANTNGRLHAATEPSLAPLNRGFLYGDAIYEDWRTCHRTVVAWHEHFDRLENSARALHLDLPWTRDQPLPEVIRTVAEVRAETAYQDDVYIRLQVWRGDGPIGLDTALADQSEFVLLVQPCPMLSPEVLKRGVKLSIAMALRRNPIETLSPAWKTGNYLNNILCLREARTRGADDVVMLNLRGEITEAATSNIAFVRKGEVFTPRIEAGILEGITRGFLLRTVAPAAGVRVNETTLLPNEIATMSECFLLSSTKDVTPVGAIDDLTFAVGPETVSAKLKAAFGDYARQSAKARPELK